MENRLLGIKRERSSEGISTQDVLSVLKTNRLDGATKVYSTGDFIEFGSYAVFDLYNGAQLIKNGRIHMVRTSDGIVFAIRKLDDKSIDTREARIVDGWTFEEHAKKCISHTNFSYVDVNMDADGCKIDIEPVRDDGKYSIKELESMFRSYMKD